jgi:hypothetical protein
MAYITGDVVANPGGELPFKVVFMQGATVLGEWEVESKEDGEEQLVDFLQSALEAHTETEADEDDEDEEGGGEDDEDEDDDDAPKRKR